MNNPISVTEMYSECDITPEECGMISLQLLRKEILSIESISEDDKRVLLYLVHAITHSFSKAKENPICFCIH